LDNRPDRRPLVHRHLRLDQLCDLRDSLCIQSGDDLPMVDQQGRALIAQAGARTRVHADPPVGTNLPAFDSQALAQVGE